MQKNDLVMIRIHNQDVCLGVVIDYRPDVLGGSGVQSWRSSGESHTRTKITQVPKRGEVLVMGYSDGSLSWYDEMHIHILTDQSQTGSQE